jgi:hypothetical protein
LLGACFFFFFSIWGGTQKGIARIKSLLINYLASGGIQRSRAKVGWLQCCQERSKGGINLINPEDAAAALMVKWIIKALELGEPNLHLLLRYRLSAYQPYPGGRWQGSLDFFMVKGHQSKQGSLGWNRTTLAWKALLPDLQFVPPNTVEELLSCSVWFCPMAPIIGPGFSKHRVSILHKAGMRKYRDIMTGRSNFIAADEAQRRFGLQEEERGAWNATVRMMSLTWQMILAAPQGRATGGEWVGIYANSTAAAPTIVIQTEERLNLYLVRGPAGSHSAHQYMQSIPNQLRSLLSLKRKGGEARDKMSGERTWFLS